MEEWAEAAWLKLNSFQKKQGDSPLLRNITLFFFKSSLKPHHEQRKQNYEDDPWLQFGKVIKRRNASAPGYCLSQRLCLKLLALRNYAAAEIDKGADACIGCSNHRPAGFEGAHPGYLQMLVRRQRVAKPGVIAGVYQQIGSGYREHDVAVKSDKW